MYPIDITWQGGVSQGNDTEMYAEFMANYL